MFDRTYGRYEAINKTTYNDAHSSRLVHIDLNYWTPALFSRALDPVWNHFNINNICLMPACTTTNTGDDHHITDQLYIKVSTAHIADSSSEAVYDILHRLSRSDKELILYSNDYVYSMQLEKVLKV